jgi:glyoxylase-like metal-dependent hydrolase (beta-lactamase superfamily II)
MSPSHITMFRIEHFGDVLRIEMGSPSGRLVGYTASAYLTRGVMVDCGFPLARRHVAAVLERYRPRGVFLTHYHEDHAGNVELVARSGIPIAASDETLARVRAPAPIRFYRRVTWGSAQSVVAPILPFESTDLSLVPAPGHSSDHHVVWDATDGTLFGGDLYLGVKVRVAHPGEEPRLLATTLRRIAALGPSRLFDAHRGFVPNPAPLLVAKADWTEDTVAAIERRVDAGAPDSRIVREVFGGESLPGYVSGGEYSRTNFVAAVRRGLTGGR